MDGSGGCDEEVALRGDECGGGRGRLCKKEASLFVHACVGGVPRGAGGSACVLLAAASVKCRDVFLHLGSGNVGKYRSLHWQPVRVVYGSGRHFFFLRELRGGGSSR